MALLAALLVAWLVGWLVVAAAWPAPGVARAAANWVRASVAGGLGLGLSSAAFVVAIDIGGASRTAAVVGDLVLLVVATTCWLWVRRGRSLPAVVRSEEPGAGGSIACSDSASSSSRRSPSPSRDSRLSRTHTASRMPGHLEPEGPLDGPGRGDLEDRTATVGRGASRLSPLAARRGGTGLDLPQAGDVARACGRRRRLHCGDRDSCERGALASPWPTPRARRSHPALGQPPLHRLRDDPERRRGGGVLSSRGPRAPGSGRPAGAMARGRVSWCSPVWR